MEKELQGLEEGSEVDIRGSLNKFLDFFVSALLLIVHT